MSSWWADILTDVVALPIKNSFYNIRNVLSRLIQYALFYVTSDFSLLPSYIYSLLKTEFSGLDYVFPMKHSSHKRVEWPFQWGLGQGSFLVNVPDGTSF